MKSNSNRRMNSGFTLIEIMIVAAIVALLAAIAFPSYQNSVLRSGRAEGQSLLLDLSARQEKFFARQGRYTDDFTDLGNYPNAGFVDSSENRYRVTIAMVGTDPNFTGFTLTATATGNQTNDTCDGYTLTNTGVKNVTTGDRDQCW